ncbi:MAG: phosphate-starvation-inducible PsiE family protein [Steroidobacteraceae bacterium]
MPEKTPASDPPPSLSPAIPIISPAILKSKTLVFYGRALDAIVTVLVIVMLLTLIGALVGLGLDFATAAAALRTGVRTHSLAHGIVDAMDRELVIDVLSVFVLIELFRTFTDYLEFHRVRLRVLSEVGIAFIMREIFVGLYDHQMEWPEILALAALLAVLVTARIAAVQFQPPRDTLE